jgi:hypothetical protein
MPVDRKSWGTVAACLCVFCGVTTLTSAQNTSFTYQGRLNDQGGPANGTYDIRFALYTNSLGAATVTGVLTNCAIVISNGLFTTTIDFGNVFDGTPYWLELGVRTNTSPADFTVLAPRQALTAVPYALQAASAMTVTGPVPDALLSTNIARLNGVSASLTFTNELTHTNAVLSIVPSVHNVVTNFDTNTVVVTGAGVASANGVYKLSQVNPAFINAAGSLLFTNTQSSNLLLFDPLAHEYDFWQIQTTTNCYGQPCGLDEAGTDFTNNLYAGYSIPGLFADGNSAVGYPWPSASYTVAGYVTNYDAVLSAGGAPLSIDWTNVAGRPNSPVELLASTHIGPTTSTIYHGSNPGYWLNLGAGASGMVRQIEFTSAPGSNNLRVLMTNYYLRVYADAGTITNSTTAPAENLLVNAPLAVLFGDKYRPGETSFLQATGSRYLGCNEIWDSTNAVGSFTFSLTLPMPFTNGILIGLFDAAANSLNQYGYSYVAYELGRLPADLGGWRLRTGLASGSYGNFNNITFLNATNAGELVSLYASFRHLNNSRTFLEGIWFIRSDGVQTPLGCAGGEDMFNNGYYFSFGPQATYNYGTVHLETPFAVEAYRHFSGADAFYWRTSATAYFQTSLTAGTPLEADILCFYYGK